MLNQGKKEPVAEKPRVTIEIENKLKEIEALHYASKELDDVISELENIKKSREYMIQKMYDQEFGSLKEMTHTEIRIIWPDKDPTAAARVISDIIRSEPPIQRQVPTSSKILNLAHSKLKGPYGDKKPLFNAADSDKLNTRLGGLLEKISAIHTQAKLEAETKKKIEEENQKRLAEEKEKKKTDEAMKLKAKNDANNEAKRMDEEDALARTTAELLTKDTSSSLLMRSTSKGLKNTVLNRQEKKGQDIETLANTLTTIDVRQFSNLTRVGLLNNLNQDENALVISRHSTQVSEYVLNDILRDTDLKRTVASIERWIDVAHHLAFKADVKNYHSSWAIYNALADENLLKLFERANYAVDGSLSKDAKDKLQKIRGIYSPNDNFKNLSNALLLDIEDNKPAIPPLNIHLKYLTAHHELKNYQEMNKLNSSLVNNIKNISNTKTFHENSSIATAISLQIIAPLSQDKEAKEAYEKMVSERNEKRDKMVPKGAKQEDILRKLGKSPNHSSKAEVTSSTQPQNNTSYLTRSMSKRFQNAFLSRTKSSANVSSTVDSVSTNKVNASAKVNEKLTETPANVSQTQTNPSPTIQQDSKLNELEKEYQELISANPFEENKTQTTHGTKTIPLSSAVGTANKYMRPINEPKQPNQVTPQGRYIPVQYVDYIKTNPDPFKKTPDRDRPNIRPSFTGLERSLASICVKAEKYNVDISEQVTNIKGMLQIIKDNEEKKKPGTQSDPNAPNIKSVIDIIKAITKKVNEGEAEAKAGNVMTPAKNKGP